MHAVSPSQTWKSPAKLSFYKYCNHHILCAWQFFQSYFQQIVKASLHMTAMLWKSVSKTSTAATPDHRLVCKLVFDYDRNNTDETKITEDLLVFLRRILKCICCRTSTLSKATHKNRTSAAENTLTKPHWYIYNQTLPIAALHNRKKFPLRSFLAVDHPDDRNPFQKLILSRL